MFGTNSQIVYNIYKQERVEYRRYINKYNNLLTKKKSIQKKKVKSLGSL